MSKCVTLTSFNLDLYYNSIGDNGAKYLREGISKCVTLTSFNLDLRENKVGDDGYKILK